MSKDFNAPAAAEKPVRKTGSGLLVESGHPTLTTDRLVRRTDRPGQSEGLGIVSGPVRSRALVQDPPGQGPLRHPFLLAFRGAWHVLEGELVPQLTTFRLMGGVNGVVHRRKPESPTGEEYITTHLVERIVDEEGGVVLPVDDVCEYIGRNDGSQGAIFDSETGILIPETRAMYRSRIRGPAGLLAKIRGWQAEGLLPTEPDLMGLRALHVQVQSRLASMSRLPAQTQGEQAQRDRLVAEAELVQGKYFELCEAAGVSP